MIKTPRFFGITLIELIILIVVGSIIVTVGMNFLATASGNSTISFGINGISEVRCIEGYKFITDQNGNTRQILDEFGKGARCQQNRGM